MLAYNKKLVLLILGTISCVKLTNANVVFRFALDFHIKDGEESQSELEEKQHINHTITVHDSRISLNDNDSLVDFQNSATVGPDIMDATWSQQNNLIEIANEQLKSSVNGISNVNHEISPLVGRSDFIATKVKLIVRYLNAASAEQINPSNVGSGRIDILRKFVVLVDQLRTANDNVGGEKSLEFTLMNLVLEKHGLFELQKEVKALVLQAEEAWQHYLKKKLVKVDA